MLIGTILTVVSVVLRLFSFALLVYCVMSFVAPTNEIYRKAVYYMERVLYPVRIWLYNWFPALGILPVDLSPLAVWLMIDVALALVNALRRLF